MVEDLSPQPPAGATREPSGLAWSARRAGDGKQFPTAADLVKIRFRGYMPDGRIFQETPPQGRQVPMGALFHAAANVLEQMSVSEKRRIWIPKELSLAFPPAWPRGDVIVDLELVEITRP